MTAIRDRPVALAGTIALLAVPVVGYRTLYATWSYVPWLGAAVVVGVAVAAATCTGLKLTGRDAVLPGVAAHTAALVLTMVGSWMVLHVASPASALTGSAHTFGRILTLNQPADVAGEVVAGPYLVTFAAAYLATVSLSTGSALLPVLAPSVALCVQVLLCAGVAVGSRVGEAATSSAFVAITALVVADGQRSRQPSRPDPHRRLRIGILGLVVVAVASGGTLAHAWSGPDRFDPRTRWHRDDGTRPVLSSLSSLKSELSEPDRVRFDVRLTGRAADRVDRITVATLGSYDGTAWTADPDFRVAGRILSRPSASADVAAHLWIAQLPGALLPVVGRPSTLTRQGPVDSADAVSFDQESGMVLAPGDVTGWRYTVRGEYQSPGAGSARPARLTPDERRQDSATTFAPALPPAFAGRPADRATLDGLATWMRDSLPYSPDGPAGSSLANLRRVLAGTGAANGGYAEQHAAAFALLARRLGFPSRVVVGYLVPPRSSGRSVRIRSGDAHAWAQVFLGPSGWVAFDPTDVHRRPTPYRADGAAPGAPPPSSTPTSTSPSTPATTPGAPPPEPGPDWREVLHTVVRRVFPILAAVAGLALAALLLLLARRGLRERRRIRAERRARAATRVERNSGNPPERIMGAWAEAVDVLRAAHWPVASSSTTAEVATAGPGTDVDVPVAELALIVERALFSPSPPRPADADRAWELVAQLSHPHPHPRAREEVS